VTVSETGFAQNATATDTTTNLPAPVLSVAKAHSGSFTQGSTASWTITVSNTAASNSVTYGPLTVTDVLPSGTLPTSVTYTYTLSSGTGTNWNCITSGTTTVTVTCTDSVDVVSGGSSFPVLTLTVNVPITSPTSVSNSATASGAGALASATGSDNNVTVVQVPKTINVISGTPQSASVTNQFAAPLVAQVLDQGGVGVNNVSVDFNSPSSGASATPNPAVATTQGTGTSAGTATVTVTANGSNGTYQVTATVAGVTSPPFTLTNTDFTLSAVAPTSTIYIQGQNAPFAPATNSVVTVSALPTPSGSQPSYTGTVTLGCSAGSLPSGVACTSFTPATASFNNGGPAANVPSSLALSVSSSTPVGLYTAAIAPTAVGVDGSNPILTRMAGFSLAVQCVLSLHQAIPAFTPATGTAANQYSIGVSVAQGGSACPYGSVAVVGGSTPGAVAGDGTVVTTILTAKSGTTSSSQPQTVTFEAGAAGISPQQGTVTVPYFDATQPTSQNTATLPVEVEALPAAPLVLVNGIAGQKTGNATLTISQTGTLTIPNVGTSGTACGVVDSNGNPDPTGNNFGLTCLWNVSTPNQVTVNLQLTTAALNRDNKARLGMVFALFLPGMVFVGAGFSVFGPRRWRDAHKRLTVVLGILLVMSLVVVLPACGGGFAATFLKTGTGNFTVTLMGYTSNGGVTTQGVEIFTIPVSAAQ